MHWPGSSKPLSNTEWDGLCLILIIIWGLYSLNKSYRCYFTLFLMFGTGLRHFKEWLVLSVSKTRKSERSFRYVWIISFCIENITLNWLIICFGTQQTFPVTSLAIFVSPHFHWGKFEIIIVGQKNELYKKFKDTVIFILLVEGFYWKLA